MKFFFLFLAAFFIAGCATDTSFVDAQKEASIAYTKSQTDIAASQHKSVEAIATSNASDSSKAMGFMMLMAQGQGRSSGQMQIQPHTSAALQWTQALAPVVGQGIGVLGNVRVATVQSNNATLLGTVQSNNATATAVSTNGAFTGIAGLIQAAPTLTTTTTTTTDRHDVITPQPLVITPTQITPIQVTPIVLTNVTTTTPVVGP